MKVPLNLRLLNLFSVDTFVAGIILGLFKEGFLGSSPITGLGWKRRDGIPPFRNQRQFSGRKEFAIMATLSKTTFAVVGVNGSGPKSTAVGLRSLDETDEIRYWAWFQNAVASVIVPGMRVTFDTVSFGKVTTTYTDKAGYVVDLKFPKQQVFWGGNAHFDAPDAEPLPEQGEVTVSDEARKFANNLLAKKAREAQVEGDSSFDEPF